MTLSRRSLLANAGRFAPLAAVGATLGRFVAPLQPTARVVQGEAMTLEVPVSPHVAVVGWVDGEEVYDPAFVAHFETSGWMLRALGQTWGDATELGKDAILVRTTGGGAIGRWAINEAIQFDDDAQARFLPRAFPAFAR